MSSDSVETQSGNPISRGISFLGDSVEELKKVSHPTRQETMQATVVTILIMAVVSMCLFLFDGICTKIMDIVLPR